MKLDVVYSQAASTAPIFVQGQKFDLTVYHSENRLTRRLLGAQNVMARPTTIKLKVGFVKRFDPATSANKLIKPSDRDITSLLGAATEIDEAAAAETQDTQPEQLYQAHLSPVSALEVYMKTLSVDVLIALRRYVNDHGARYEGRIK